jgi:hypothetical protein
MHKFSANRRRHPRPSRGPEPAYPRLSLERVPLFSLFLQEIISDEALLPRRNAQFRQGREQNNSGNVLRMHGFDRELVGKPS